MVKKTGLDYYTLLFILIPIITLLEGIFKPPIMSVDIDSNLSTFPFILSILFLINIFNLKLKTNQLSIFYFVLIILSYLISFNFYVDRIGTIITFIISSALVFHVYSRDDKLKIIYYFVLCFTLLSFAIYFYRLFSYDFNFIRVRSGANIFGGNTLFIVQVLYLALEKYFYPKNSKRHNIVFILIIINSILFINRLSILLIPILYLFNYGLRKSFYVITFFSLLFQYFFSLIEDFDLYTSILMRFSSIDPFQTRNQLLIDGVNLFLDNPLTGVGLGMFKYFSYQTSAHNLFVNIFAEMGFILGIPLIILLLLPIYKFFIKKKNQSLIYYFAFLMVSIVAGEKLLQFSGYISSLNSIMIISILMIQKK